jgi:hypothetical protein
MNEPRLSYLIGRLDRVLRRQLSTAVEANGMTLPAYTTLSVLRADDGLSNAQLARRSMVTPQSMSDEAVDEVERAMLDDLGLDEVETFRDLLRRSSLALVEERTGQTSA